MLYFPFKRRAILKRHRKPFILLTLSLISLAFYSHTFYSIEIKSSPTFGQQCTVSDSWAYLVKTFSFMDAILTFLLPFLIVLVLNVAILQKMRNFKRTPKIPPQFLKPEILSYHDTFITIDTNQQMRQRANTLDNSIRHVSFSKSLPHKSSRYRSSSTFSSRFMRSSVLSRSRQSSRESTQLVLDKFNNFEIHRRRKIYRKMATVLMIISICFLLLNSLMFVSKTVYFFRGLGLQHQFRSYNNNNYKDDLNKRNATNEGYIVETLDQSNYLKASNLDQLLERISCYFYYLNFSVNFFLYTLTSSKLKVKQVILEQFKFKSSKKKSPKIQVAESRSS